MGDLFETVVDIVADALDLPRDGVADPQVSQRSSCGRARYLVAYLLHTSCGLSLRRVAAVMQRDRQSICRVVQCIEDRRDCPRYDAWVAALERRAEQDMPHDIDDVRRFLAARRTERWRRSIENSAQGLAA